jgi:hypothetical protein
MATVAQIGTVGAQPDAEATLGVPGGEHRGSEATRYLCAAAYLDLEFRKRALATVEKEPLRALAPNYGCDLGVVLSHCLRARRITRIRDVCLTVLFLVPLLTPGFLSDLGYVFSDADYFGDNLEWFLKNRAGTLSLTFALATAVIFTELFVVRFRILRNQLSKTGFVEHNRPSPVAAKLVPAEIARGQAHNVVVYGDFTPFVGAGTTIGGWSFALRTDKGRENIKGSPEIPRPFSVAELYQYVTAEIESLNLSNLRIQPRVYIDGRSVREDRRFLPKVVGRPRHHLETGALESVRDQHGGSARWYLAVEITDWSGELVLTIFVRFQQLPKTLFVEANYALLTPFKESFYRIDQQDFELRPGALGELMFQAALLTLGRWPTAPFRTAALACQPIGGLAEVGANVRAVERNPGYNYGAKVSLRESAADQRYRVYFQRLDKDMHLKMVEKRLLDALVEFLDEHGIDTSGLKERETTILNNGVMISGGSLQAENLAVGDKAQAVAGRFQRAAQGSEGKKAA